MFTRTAKICQIVRTRLLGKRKHEWDDNAKLTIHLKFTIFTSKVFLVFTVHLIKTRWLNVEYDGVRVYRQIVVGMLLKY